MTSANYPVHTQVCRVPPNGSSVVAGNPLVVWGLTQQYHGDLTFRDREPCYVLDPNGLIVPAGQHLCRLVGNYLGLPLYATIGISVGSVISIYDANFTYVTPRSSLLVECWGIGGTGSQGSIGATGGGGGGGGEYVKKLVTGLTVGSSYSGTVATTPGNITWFVSPTTVKAMPGANGGLTTGGAGGTGGIGDFTRGGGNGGDGGLGASVGGGGGGGSGDDGAAGSNGGNESGGTGGTAGSPRGGAGGTVGASHGVAGTLPGGGGGGGGSDAASKNGALGGTARIKITPI